MVKGDEGAVGLMQNLIVLRGWLISGPEIAIIADEIQQSTMKRRKGFRTRLPRMSKH